ncbi:MAG TPA: addiction module protein [Rhizomicrobium sp.]|jgi:putative addiction module component (TIGR02574 family)
MNDISELFKLSVAERIQLAGDLWDSVAAEPQNLPPLTEAQCAEIDRRLAEHEKNPAAALDWNTVRERLWARVK